MYENAITRPIKTHTSQLQLFVREDGTVDWDGALASGKEMAKFGGELWDRLNGQHPEGEQRTDRQEIQETPLVRLLQCMLTRKD